MKNYIRTGILTQDLLYAVYCVRIVFSSWYTVYNIIPSCATSLAHYQTNETT